MTATSSTTRADRRLAKQQDPDRIGFGRMFAWSSSHASQAGSVLILGYFAIYCTDTLGLNAGIVGTLLLLSKIVDAVGVLLSGYVVDRAPETRWGKARPFDLAIVGIWVFTAIMFSTPAGLNDVAKYIWVFACFLMVSAIFTPLFLANQPLFMARAFRSREAITKVSSLSGIFIGLGGVIVGISFPIFIQTAGKDPASWSIIAILYAIPLVLLGLVRFFVIRETHSSEAELPLVTFAQVRTVLASNPYLWGVAGIQLVASVLGNFGALTYYYRYIVGNIALQGIFGIFAILLFPLFAFLPRLIRRFSVSALIAAAGVLGIIGFTMYAYAGTNVPLLAIAAIFTAASSLPMAFLLPILIIDNSTYNEWKGNRRLESVGGAIVAFAMNLGTGAAAGISGIVLASLGYDGTRDTQIPSATTGIVLLTSWVPAAMSIIVIALSIAYNRFERRLPTITREIEVRRVSSGAVALQAANGTTITILPSADTQAISPDDGDRK